MRDTLAIMTVSGDERYRAHARRVADHFAKLNDMPVKLYDETEIGDRLNMLPHYLRYYMWELVPKSVERIVYVDVDMLPVRPLPEPPDVDFCAVNDIEWTYRENARLSPVAARAGVHYNSGLFVAKRKTAPIFQRVAESQSMLRGNEDVLFYLDQTRLNIELQLAVEAGEVTTAELPKQWNYLILLEDEWVPDPYMIHFASVEGHTKYTKMRFIHNLIDAYDRIEAGVRSRQMAESNGTAPDS